MKWIIPMMILLMSSIVLAGTPTNPYSFNLVEDKTFLGLTDTPNNYTGSAEKCVIVNDQGSALEFLDCNMTTSGNTSADIWKIAGNGTLFFADDYQIHNQDLNTTSDVTFNKVSSNDWTNVSGINITNSLNWINGSDIVFNLSLKRDLSNSTFYNPNLFWGNESNKFNLSTGFLSFGGVSLKIPTIFCDSQSLGPNCMMENLNIFNIRGKRTGAILFPNDNLDNNWKLDHDNGTGNFFITSSGGFDLVLPPLVNSTKQLVVKNITNPDESVWWDGNHTTEDNNRGFDITYVNNNKSRYYIHRATVSAFIASTGDSAYAEAYVNNVLVARGGINQTTDAEGDAASQISTQLNFNLAPDDVYSINTSVSGAGALFLEAWLEDAR